jgi:hypothetical protein
MMTLANYLQLYQEPAAFSWITRNCSTFCAHWVEEREGFNPMDGLGEIHSENEAQRIIGRFGGLAKAWTHQLKRAPQPWPLMAQPGDVVLVPSNSGQGEAVGICVGAQVAVVLSTGVIGFVPLEVARACWRIK